MSRSHFAKRFALSVAFTLVFACATFAIAGDDIATQLAIVGAECETSDKGDVIGVNFLGELAAAEDLSYLAGLDHVVEISISGVDLGDDALRHLNSLSTLKRLDASDTKCTDSDIKHLAGLVGLEKLNLSETAITDASIATLAKLRNLKWVDLSSTRITPDGLRRLRHQLPELHINEWWDYQAGIMGGRGLLDIQRATIIFDYVKVRGSGGAWSGGAIEISKPSHDEADFTSTSNGTGSNGTNSVSASLAYIDGVPTIHVGKHVVEIKNEGADLFVDGTRFQIGKKKLRISLSEDGVATLLN